MSKGWLGERQRHAMSARGITSTSPFIPHITPEQLHTVWSSEVDKLINKVYKSVSKDHKTFTRKDIELILVVPLYHLEFADRLQYLQHRKWKGDWDYKVELQKNEFIRDLQMDIEQPLSTSNIYVVLNHLEKGDEDNIYNLSEIFMTKLATEGY